MSSPSSGKFAVVTGGSAGIGYELAKQFLQNGFDVLIAADRDVGAAETELKQSFPARTIESLSVDLATREGVDHLYDALERRGGRIDALAANAGIGHGKSFFDQERQDWMKVIETNVIGTLDLVHRVGRGMRANRQGRILITSSIASQIPGPYNAVYNASKAFLQSFAFAIRNELRESGVSVTALLPGATDTDFFDRADLADTEIGQGKKDDPAEVAETGFAALMKGEGDVVFGLKNKLQTIAAKVVPDDRLAESHRKMAEPGSGAKS